MQYRNDKKKVVDEATTAVLQRNYLTKKPGIFNPWYVKQVGNKFTDYVIHSQTA